MEIVHSVDGAPVTSRQQWNVHEISNDPDYDEG